MLNECLLCKAFTPACSTPKAIRILSAETKQQLGFYEEERGENVWLVVPNDEGVFHCAAFNSDWASWNSVKSFCSVARHL